MNLAPAARPRRAPAWPVAPAARSPGALIGQLLVARGAVDPGDLVRALALKGREDARLGEILLTHGMVGEAELYAALADQWSARVVDLIAEPPDPRLIDAAGADFCLRHRIVPWRRVGGATVIATARPEEFARRIEELPAALGPALMAVAPERDVLDALVAVRSAHLAARAETCAPAAESCRTWDGRRFSRLILAGLGAAAAAALLAPAAFFALLTVLATLVLVVNMSLRAIALRSALAELARRPRDPLAHQPQTAIVRLPVVSILVPLFQERDIAERLVARLDRLSYPRELLDICLVTEEDDATTRATLAGARLPRWIRVVTVPSGTLRTKPRALNYALDFARGSIIGVYDAEDAPDPDQIHRIVARFHERGPEVACLQGVLDYYNARTNWMARCFTIEYAAWYRMVLPALERLGFAIPLGGTTLFFRRAALEALGRWDAHNVTEDADLGVRLARHGYRAELIDTVTREEANCRPWAWVRQRSRWIKGYAMTWAVHMRDPARLWRELGPRRFIGVQILFGGSLLSVFLAPVLWSYWLLALDLPHPLRGLLPRPVGIGIAVTFFAAYLLNLAVMVAGCCRPEHRHLLPWTVTVDLYFPLATLAAAKALWEMVTRPFYWDKTAHGVHDAAEAAETAAAAAAGAAPAGAAPKGWSLPPRLAVRRRPALAERIGD
ncbi:MAG: glycosyltransferase [Rhodobacteraceae bacterium]|nr:glycosyltransferase [Paracoccaceae bacterium]